MPETEFWKHIESKFNFDIQSKSRLSGGSINSVFKISTSKGELVIKCNDKNRFPKMFEVEAEGLKLLASSEGFIIPEVIDFGDFQNQSFLLLEFIETGKSSTSYWSQFSKDLAKLHRVTSKNFGLDYSNYIGSLPQTNDHYKTASEFYIRQRLEPQFELAFDKGYKFQNIDALYKIVEELIPNEPPSLIHGDLWSGNSMVSAIGEPVLIDPAVCFSLREMDLAMMRLFGGFSADVFRNYNALFPLADGHEERVELFQLYYVLVHLNLFGGGYYSQTLKIFSKYI